MDRVDIIKELRKRMSRIEQRNPNFINSEKWKYYKNVENKLYEEINLEKS